MANFLLLYTGGEGTASTEAEQAAILQAWGAWFGSLGSAVVDGGNPFTGTAKNITAKGQISDGPVGTLATGYSIIKADSLESALAMAQGCPQLQSGGQITVYETYQV